MELFTTKGVATLVGSVLLGGLIAPTQAALIARYDFEGTTPAAAGTVNHGTSGDLVSDTSGNGRTGTLIQMYNAPMPTLSSTAKVGSQALSVSAPKTSNNISTGFVSLGNPAALQISGALTLSAWVSLTSPLGAGQDIISKGAFGGNRGYILTVGSDGLPVFAISPDGSAQFSATGTTPLAANQYALVTGVYDPTGASNNGVAGSYLYINGVLAASNTTAVPASQFVSTANANIGTRGAAPTNDSTTGLTGLIDDARIYNEALTPAAVAAIYSSAVPEPASLGLLAASAIGLMGRRRSAR